MVFSSHEEEYKIVLQDYLKAEELAEQLETIEKEYGFVQKENNELRAELIRCRKELNKKRGI